MRMGRSSLSNCQLQGLSMTGKEAPALTSRGVQDDPAGIEAV